MAARTTQEDLPNPMKNPTLKEIVIKHQQKHAVEKAIGSCGGTITVVVGFPLLFWYLTYLYQYEIDSLLFFGILLLLLKR